MITDHPAYREEKGHLDETLELIRRERVTAREEKEAAEGKLSHARMYDPDALPIREMLYYRALQNLKNMDAAYKNPYFTRVDFTEDDGEKQAVYIGKFGVSDSSVREVRIVDWRAPIANLYYAGQIGPMHYDAPDGRISGEVSLKRQIGIEDSELKTIFDADLVTQDAYLQSVLGSMSGARLKDIVTTIQSEQNIVIRFPMERSLVVQGAAGSGKTTIALHRIAYLLYTYADTVAPDRILILAPNPLFLNYISLVLPDLGVERVRQSTFLLFMKDWMGDDMPRIETGDRTEKVFSLSPEDYGKLSRIARLKGSLVMEKALEEWLDGFERSFAPAEGFSFGPVKLFTKAELDTIFLVDEKPFAMKRRVDEFAKQLKRAVKGAAARLKAWYASESARREKIIQESGGTEEEIHERILRLHLSTDKAVKQMEEQAKQAAASLRRQLPSLDTEKLYTDFWKAMLDRPDAAMREAAAYTLDRYNEKHMFEQEDIASLALITLRMQERAKPDIRHIVIDEAQDLSQFEIRMLTRIIPRVTMTIVGDMMQGINGWRGLDSWSSITGEVLGRDTVYRQLVTSYRSTVEIMEFAQRIADRYPVKDQQPVHPVLRHGDTPVIETFPNNAERLEAIRRTVSEWREKGFLSIALIAGTEKEARLLEKHLSADLGAVRIREDDETYSGGLLIARASGVKGLEFDGVIVTDADEETYRDRAADARLLYVCVTRALHAVRVFSLREKSKLL